MSLFCKQFCTRNQNAPITPFVMYEYYIYEILFNKNIDMFPVDI